jgi:hypothetical protein
MIIDHTSPLSLHILLLGCRPLRRLMPCLTRGGAMTSLRSSSNAEAENPYSETQRILSRAADSHLVFTAANGGARAQLFVRQASSA